MLTKLMQHVNLETISTKIIDFLPNLVGAIVLLVVFWVVTKLVSKLVGAALQRARVPDDAGNLLVKFIRYGIAIIALLTIADQLGIDVTSLIAGVGIAGLAISFAAQDTIANLISGVTLIIDRPFKQGDWICVGDLHASVTDVRLRSTVLTTFDNETLVLPNKSLSQEKIINYTLTPKIRARVPVGIAYKEDTAAARRVMLDTIRGDDRILDSPAPVVVVTSLGDSSVNIELRFWTENAIQKFPLEWEYTEKCKRALDAADIEIPFPHLQLFLEQSAGLDRLAPTT